MQNNNSTYKITTGIIPEKQHFVGEPLTLHKEAICVFAATGFFLDQDTYFKEQKVLKPGCHYEIDADSKTIRSQISYFNWHYTPKERPFEHVVEEFAELFECILKEQLSTENVILPLSGGLDSRTQAVALHYLGIKAHSYSYAFENGHDETKYGKDIAKACHYPFEALKVTKGYLWKCIDDLAEITQCYSEFTHTRQMAFINRYSEMGTVFSLGHWGDVLFDDMGVAEDLSLEDQVEVLFKKIVKKGGLELAKTLWVSWSLEGDFKTYLKQRILDLLKTINITNSANAQIRAFKSLYWAPRWTSVNLRVFDSVKPIRLPYYDNRMCEFICTVPERYLAGRQLQIAYIKKRMPEVAKLTWQAHRPFNLYTYSKNKTPWNLPYRIRNKAQRVLSQKPYVQRNWELQFLGEDNSKALENRLFQQAVFKDVIDPNIVEQYYNLFKDEDSVYYSHAVSMLLTLSVFSTNVLKPL